MKSSLTVLMAVSCLVIATASFAQTKPLPLPSKTAPSSGSAEKQSITYVEVIQLDPKTLVFNAKLVNVNTGMVMLELTGKGAELQNFQKQSTEIAPRGQTVTLTGPSPHTADIIIKPPNPPGPAGGDLLHLAKQVANSYEASLAQQLKLNIQPGQIRPGAIDPRIQPGAQSPVANPNAQPGAPSPKK
jgi:hypothetical protein